MPGEAYNMPTPMRTITWKQNRVCHNARTRSSVNTKSSQCDEPHACTYIGNMFMRNKEYAYHMITFCLTIINVRNLTPMSAGRPGLDTGSKKLHLTLCVHSDCKLHRSTGGQATKLYAEKFNALFVAGLCLVFDEVA